MTDNEIIKFMQCVIGNEMLCSECTYQKVLPFPSCRMMCAKNALDLINRQKEEIDRLNIELQSMRSAANSYKMHYETAKSEAIKEFAERLKTKLQWDTEFENMLVFETDIDNLVKEMMEVNENDRAERLLVDKQRKEDGQNG